MVLLKTSWHVVISGVSPINMLFSLQESVFAFLLAIPSLYSIVYSKPNNLTESLIALVLLCFVGLSGL